MTSGEGGAWKALLDPRTIVLLMSGIGAFIGQWYVMGDQLRSMQADNTVMRSDLRAMQTQINMLETDDAVVQNRLHNIESRNGF